jgi:hypothetical protein
VLRCIASLGADGTERARRGEVAFGPKWSALVKRNSSRVAAIELQRLGAIDDGDRVSKFWDEVVTTMETPAQAVSLARRFERDEAKRRSTAAMLDRAAIAKHRGDNTAKDVAALAEPMRQLSSFGSNRSPALSGCGFSKSTQPNVRPMPPYSTNTWVR